MARMGYGGGGRRADGYLDAGWRERDEGVTLRTQQGGGRSDRRSPRRTKRPAFSLLVIFTVLARAGRGSVDRLAESRVGFAGLVAVGALGLVVVLTWQMDQRRRMRARGGDEFTSQSVVQQIADSGLDPPAFAEDGTLLGASVLVVNQKSKVLEVNTAYEVFGWDGERLGGVRQIGQSRGKQFVRIFTAFDQFFTHEFEIFDTFGAVVLRLCRPRKVFRTRVEVSDGAGRFIGTIRQRNLFWKIRFDLEDSTGSVIGHLRAENLRAWDFQVLDRREHTVAEIVKSWEGWARTAFTRADRYTVRIDEPLGEPLRSLTIAAALAADLALKQDARGIG